MSCGRAGRSSDPALWFSSAELAASSRYHRALGQLRTARGAADLAVPLAFVAFGLADLLVQPYPASMWADRALTVAFALEFAAWPHRAALGGWEEVVHERHRVHRDAPTDHGGNGADRGDGDRPVSWWRCFVVAGCASLLRLVLGIASIVLAVALVGATTWWPLLLGGAAAAVLVLSGALYPLVAPVLEGAVPLADRVLGRRVDALADRAGLSRPRVLVAMGRSVGEGAYVAGFGRGRRLVLSGSVLDGPETGVDSVVAHELAHWSLHHHGLAAAVAVQAARVWVLWAAIALWGGHLAPSAADARLLPLFVVVTLVSGTVGNLVLASHSRFQERAADSLAAQLLGHPAPDVRYLCRVVLDAGADLQPTTWRRLCSSHPPPAERLATASAGRSPVTAP